MRLKQNTRQRASHVLRFDPLDTKCVELIDGAAQSKTKTKTKSSSDIRLLQASYIGSIGTTPNL